MCAMIVTPKIELVQVIVTEIKQMTLSLYLSYLITKFTITFTSLYAIYMYTGTIKKISKNIMLAAFIHCSHVEQIAKG